MSDSPPTSSIYMDLVSNENGDVGGFGPVLRDISRVGHDSRRFQRLWDRGDKVTVQATKYHESESDAQSYTSSCEELQGEVVTLYSSLDDKSYVVFIHRVAASYFRISSTDSAKQWRAEYRITLERTQ